VGGSGTRVVAEILSTLGFYIGSDLNEASDNLLFTLLFKRPKWLLAHHKNRAEIETGIHLFHKIMTGGDSLSGEELRFLARACGSMALHGNNVGGTGRGPWVLRRIWNLLAKDEGYTDRHIGWGWKEPNTHLFIQNLANTFEDFKYIHTIRNGLDMAFSKNQQQLYNWGPLHDVPRPTKAEDEPAASFKYWVRANENVARIGEQLGDDKFLLVNFDELCLTPKPWVDRIISFLGIKPDEARYNEALKLPKPPKSMGRYKAHDLNQFDPADLLALEGLGFPPVQPS
jgi:hypothetical protein